MTVNELLSRMSSTELTEWIAYERVAGPIGPMRNDIQAAIVSATVANANSGKGRKAKVDHFIPKWDKKKPQQTWQEQLALVEKLNASFGGTVST